MTLEELNGYLLICFMIGIIFLSTRFVSSVRYKGHGIYYITVNGWIRRNKDYLQWLKHNTVYHWFILLVVALVPIILALIPNFKDGRMLVRPELAFWVSTLVWGSIFWTYMLLFRKLRSI